MRTPFLKDLNNCVEWFSTTFAARDAARFRADIPGFFARWMFRIGTIGAVIQIPITCFFIILTVTVLVGGLIYGKSFGVSKEMLIVPYVIVNYAVWIGWGWRSRKRRGAAISMLFWFGSAAFNAIHPIKCWVESESSGEFFRGLWSPFDPGLLWFIALSGASLIALFLEISRPNCDNKTI